MKTPILAPASRGPGCSWCERVACSRLQATRLARVTMSRHVHLRTWSDEKITHFCERTAAPGHIILHNLLSYERKQVNECILVTFGDRRYRVGSARCGGAHIMRKRLFELVPGAPWHVFLTVALRWLGLVSDIALVWVVCSTLTLAVRGGLNADGMRQALAK